MILPTLKLHSRANQCWKFSGMDCIEYCIDKNHFLSYAHDITYKYNSRGFRDQEWPESMKELKNAIWCIGDSFTVGVGSTVDHIWPNRLAAQSGRRVINVSMDGASNKWIARTTEKIVNDINPKNIIIMWSYTSRRENPNMSLSDEDRRIGHVKSSHQEDLDDFVNCKQQVDCITDTSVQFAIPNFIYEMLSDVSKTWEVIRDKTWPLELNTVKDLHSLPQRILDEITNYHNCFEEIEQSLSVRQIKNIIRVNRLDLARDGHHFDLITADWVAKQAMSRLTSKILLQNLNNSNITD